MNTEALDTKKKSKYVSPEYRAWQNMKARCNNPNSSNYSYYGGRGIKVCDEWNRSFAAFYEYVGDKPSPTHSIDRIDNAKGYEPGNVRWATKQEQNYNRRHLRVSKSGEKHIYYVPRDYNCSIPYQVNVVRNRKPNHIGDFATLEEAIIARDNWLKENPLVLNTGGIQDESPAST